MGDDVDVGKAEPPEPATVSRVDGLAGEFGVRIDTVGAVHGTGAAAHDDAVIASQDLPEADFMEKSVLGRDMAAAEDDPIRFRHQLPDIAGITTVKHGHRSHLDARIADTEAHTLQDGVRERAVVGGGADQEGPRMLRQGGLDSGEKAVVFGEMILPVTGRTACQEKRHSAKITIIGDISAHRGGRTGPGEAGRSAGR